MKNRPMRTCTVSGWSAGRKCNCIDEIVAGLEATTPRRRRAAVVTALSPPQEPPVRKLAPAFKRPSNPGSESGCIGCSRGIRANGADVGVVNDFGYQPD